MFIILYGSFLVLHMDRQKGRFGTTATSIGSQTAAPWCPKVHLVAVDIVKEVHDLLVPFHGHWISAFLKKPGTHILPGVGKIYLFLFRPVATGSGEPWRTMANNVYRHRYGIYIYTHIEQKGPQKKQETQKGTWKSGDVLPPRKQWERPFCCKWHVPSVFHLLKVHQFKGEDHLRQLRPLEVCLAMLPLGHLNNRLPWLFLDGKIYRKPMFCDVLWVNISREFSLKRGSSQTIDLCLEVPFLELLL